MNGEKKVNLKKKDSKNWKQDTVIQTKNKIWKQF